VPCVAGGHRTPSNCPIAVRVRSYVRARGGKVRMLSPCLGSRQDAWGRGRGARPTRGRLRFGTTKMGSMLQSYRPAWLKRARACPLCATRLIEQANHPRSKVNDVTVSLAFPSQLTNPFVPFDMESLDIDCITGALYSDEDWRQSSFAQNMRSNSLCKTNDADNEGPPVGYGAGR
jgi:hypothetical protein